MTHPLEAQPIFAQSNPLTEAHLALLADCREVVATQKLDAGYWRRIFAASAMQGLLSCKPFIKRIDKLKSEIPLEQVVANAAVSLADLLLAKLEAGGGA